MVISSFSNTTKVEERFFLEVVSNFSNSYHLYSLRQVKLRYGQEVAVKRLSKNTGHGLEQFKTEVDVVAKLQHKNLVKLLGFCTSSKEKMLVYEFLSNSRLDKFIFGNASKNYQYFFQRNETNLEWQTRFKIIIGIARGLLYLHEDSRLKIVHRDLKSSNILQDDER
ncbi:Cysteine-rich receptor-like protein kinase 5 [Bienertia sinuspersici]